MEALVNEKNENTERAEKLETDKAELDEKCICFDKKIAKLKRTWLIWKIN